jgi:hypothetical protein
LTHARLGCHIIYVTKQFISSTSLIREIRGKSMFVVDSIHCIKDINFCPSSNDINRISEEVLNGLDEQIGTYLNTHSVDCKKKKKKR